MSIIRKIIVPIFAVTLLSAVPAVAQSPSGGSDPNCKTCGGTKIDNNVNINIDLSKLGDALKSAIDGLILLGLKPTYAAAPSSGHR